MTRKLSVFPSKPTPSPETAPSTFHSSIGFSTPENVAKKPHPPQYPNPSISPPPFSFPIVPELPPPLVLASSGFHLPPCNPAYDGTAPTPQSTDGGEWGCKSFGVWLNLVFLPRLYRKQWTTLAVKAVLIVKKLFQMGAVSITTVFDVGLW
ncbi:hypothetical protein V6N13_052651 [Hibiscus sabdariffa]|uniref:Uncharacterized protein n=1 Tax=Hibiscus sabdariffa TaxID=183260 RepID=A0ABR2Q5J0_9ROSI